ncbi:MAG: YtxH domain-containing protein [Gemmatimonadota bacterium]
MEYDDGGQAFNFLSGLIFGAALGAGLALLMAPDSGRKTRKRITRVADDLRENASDRWEDVADEVKDKVDDAFKGARKRLSL